MASVPSVGKAADSVSVACISRETVTRQPQLRTFVVVEVKLNAREGIGPVVRREEFVAVRIDYHVNEGKVQ